MLEASTMAERGKDKKCSDCANWKVKDSQCTYYDDIVHGIIHKTDDACSDFYPKENQKSKKTLKHRKTKRHPSLN
jgi:hypothetical protein